MTLALFALFPIAPTDVFAGTVTVTPTKVSPYLVQAALFVLKQNLYLNSNNIIKS